MKKILLALCLMLTAPALAENPLTIDGTTNATAGETIDKIRKALSDKEKRKFNQGLISISMVYQNKNKTLNHIDGLTADEIINFKIVTPPKNSELIALRNALRTLEQRVIDIESQLEEKITKKNEENKQKMASEQALEDYKSKIKVYTVKVNALKTKQGHKLPEVSFKIKNEGDKTLNTVGITFYFKDKSGAVIAEKTFNPIQFMKLSAYSTEPLKAGYIWQKKAYDDPLRAYNVPSEWDETSYFYKITKVEFSED